MFYYVEFLRATRALRIVGIILGVMLLAGIVFRVSFGSWTMSNDYADALEKSPTAHVTRTLLPNGDTRVVVDDPKNKIHAVINHHAESRTVTTIDVREGGPARRHDRVVTGGVTTGGSDVQTRHTTLTFGTGMTWWWGALLTATIPLGLLVATILAGPLSKENDGHLELAWTKPVSRERYALAAGVIDAIAIVLSQLAAVVLMLLVSVLWSVTRIGFDEDSAVQIGLALVAPIAWYACLTALSASMKRGPGAVIGVGWVVAIVVPAIAGNTKNGTWPVERMIHAISTALSYVDPMTYVWFQSDDAVVVPARSEPIALLVLAAMAVVYVALAVAQWRRVEA